MESDFQDNTTSVDAGVELKLSYQTNKLYIL